MLKYPVEFLSISKGITKPHTIDNSIIAQKRNIDFLPPRELTMHAHPYFSLLYIIDSEDFPSRFNGCEFRFKKNHMYFQPPNTLHTPTEQYTGTKSGIVLRFNVNDDNLIDRLGSEPSVICCDEPIKALILEIGDFEGKILKQQTLNEQTFKLLKMFLNTNNKNYITAKGCNECTGDSFTRLIKYMYAHYDGEITLTDMAKVMHMEATYFVKKFKSKYNITPINYLYSVRLFRSLDILMYTNISIAGIAEKVGFKNVASFCTAFRRAYGLSPGEYRKEAQKRKFDIVT